MGIPGVLPVKPFTVGGTEFLSPVIQTGHLHKLSAAGAGKAPQHRPVLISRVELRLLSIGQAAACIGAEAPVLVLGRKGFPAHFTVFYYFHRLRSSPSEGTQTHKGAVLNPDLPAIPESMRALRRIPFAANGAPSFTSLSLYVIFVSIFNLAHPMIS